MNRTILLICFCCLLITTKAQTPRPDSANVLRQLLAMPAPTPRTAEVVPPQQTARERAPQFFAKDKAPPDDAPMDDLLEYWTRWADNNVRPVPSDAVRQRLFDACAGDTERLSLFLPLLSPNEATAARVKELYDKEPSDQEGAEYLREKLRKWLLFNSKYFLNELQALANKVRENDKLAYVEKEDALSALARVDWQTAEPLLTSLLGRGQPRTKALALALFYRHAIGDKDPEAGDRYRSDLKSIAADRNAPGRARDTAIETLSLTEWSGRDEWYLSLFQDETLLLLRDGSTGFSPLTTLFQQDPDKWIPVMTRLVEGKDQTARSSAAACLIIFQNQNARKDALKPLLPWLSNPEWARDRGMHRLRLIQSMENVDLPESVPGLIWAVEHDNSEFGSDRSYAAKSLAKYKDPRAVPALKKALSIEKDENHRARIIQGLLASGGLTETEQVEALEMYAAKLTTAEGREELARYRSYRDDPLPVPVSMGNSLSRMEDVPASLVHAVMARAAVLQKNNPRLGQSLLEVAHRWQGRQIDLDLIDRIAAGTADTETIAKALERREKLRESVGSEMQALVDVDGPASGIAAVLLANDSLAQSVLSSGGQPAQVALLACARLTQMALPIDDVGPLMRSKNPLLALAAERYLLAEDSKAARELLWARHPGEAFVTGWRENNELIGNEFEVMAKVEEKLRAELFKENPPLEIFALLSNDELHGQVLRVYRDRAIYTYYENPARYRERVVPKGELTAFRTFVTTNNLEDLGPQFRYCHHNCRSAEFLSITKEKGRRVFSHQSGWPLLADFALLGRGESAKTHYNLENEINGLEVLYADDKLVVKDVWQRGTDIRVFVERYESPEESDERTKAFNSSAEEGDETARAELRQQEIAREKARFSWRTFANNKPHGVTSQPDGYSTFDGSKFPPADGESDSSVYDGQAQFITDDSIVLTRNFDGLWRQTAGQKAVRISGEEGAYGDPIVTSDRKWVIVSKTDDDWSKPNYIARFNLQTGREYRVGIPPADSFDAIAFVAAHGKVLLRRAKDEYAPGNKLVGPDAPEYYLLDAATGQSQPTSGVFAPLLQEGKRFLQPTGKPNEFWAAIPDSAKNQTRVGRYNLKDFSFQSVLLVPHITFESMSMWVDETGAKLYIVYEGQLLRLPLRTAP